MFGNEGWHNPFLKHLFEMNESALIILGIQNDFSELGNSTVSGFEEVSEKISELSSKFHKVFVINDSHPADHISFAACHPWRKPFQKIFLEEKEQLLWPIHCVSETIGALNPSWIQKINPVIIKKGLNKYIDNQGAFARDPNFIDHNLDTILKKENIKQLFIVGFPLEYDIKNTCEQAIELGYQVYIITDCILALENEKREIIFSKLRDLKVITLSLFELNGKKLSL